VAEGAMSCVDCHNQHGIIRPAMTQIFAANETGCFKCHGDKRGPFTFEHAPVRFEGCGTCHEPHGSANPRMLTRQEVRFVCLECHANLPGANGNAALGVVPPAFHDLRSPRFQNCTVCHQKVHGSHVDRNLLR
jgi:DmsE family decaheme c-type cytochrome